MHEKATVQYDSTVAWHWDGCDFFLLNAGLSFSLFNPILIAPVG